MVTEETLAFEWRDLTLVGALHLPDSQGPHSTVVLMQGSGPSDRTSNGYFPPIRDAFLDRGIATFAFDKPGCGDSTGDWREHALADRADQVETALQAVRHHHETKTDQVGIWGQSQGGWLAQILASRSTDLPFAVANSGPSLNIPDQDLYGCEHEMRANGYSETDVRLALAFVTNLHQAAKVGLSYTDVESRLLDSARTQPWYDYLTIDDEEDWELTRKLVTERYEPLEALRQVRCPFLAVYGGRDVLLPAWRSARESGQALQQAGISDTTVVVFPDGDHRIKNEQGGFVSGYLNLLGDWMAQRLA